MIRKPSAVVLALLAAGITALPSGAQVQTTAAPAPGPAGTDLPYADLADLVLAAPVIADVTIRSAARIKGAEATGVAPGIQRFYVQGDVGALIRGTAGLPPRVGYLLDVAQDVRGRTPKLRKMRVLIFARGVPGSVDQLQLVAPAAQIAWTASADAQVRAIATAAVATDAPPAITGIGTAFHVPGALPGEGETQVFLRTANARPVSLSVLRRPGERRRWSVALGEIVDEASGPPARDTLLWYRLACGLPTTLPASSTASLDPADAATAQEDYRFVVEALGPCGRTSAR